MCAKATTHIGCCRIVGRNGPEFVFHSRNVPILTLATFKTSWKREGSIPGQEILRRRRGRRRRRRRGNARACAATPEEQEQEEEQEEEEEEEEEDRQQQRQEEK